MIEVNSSVEFTQYSIRLLPIVEKLVATSKRETSSDNGRTPIGRSTFGRTFNALTQSHIRTHLRDEARATRTNLILGPGLLVPHSVIFDGGAFGFQLDPHKVIPNHFYGVGVGYAKDPILKSVYENGALDRVRLGLEAAEAEFLKKPLEDDGRSLINRLHEALRDHISRSFNQ